MAKVLDPLHSGEARGALGGLVYNTWRGIHTVKTNTAPGHQDDPKRQAHKAIVQAAAIRWQSISAAQRAAWNLYAAEHPQLDWTGKPQRIAGYHWYVRIQTTRQDIGEGYDDDPPADPVVNWMAGVFPTGGVLEAFIEWAPDTPDPYATYYADLWLAGPHSAGRSPSIHDATRYHISDIGDCFYQSDALAAGWYTWFLRIIKANGLYTPWQKAEPVEVTAS